MKQFQQALKILVKFRLYFTINLIGLVLCLACSMTIIRYLHQELTVDHYIPNLDRTYIFIREFTNQPPRPSGNSDRNSDPNHVNILADPAVEAYTTYMPVPGSDIVVNDERYKVNTIITDNMFLDVLPYPLKAGSAVFNSPNDVIITDKLAKRLFGKDNPLGKSITLHTGDILTVTGVLNEPRTKSTINFDLLANEQLNNHWAIMDYDVIRLYPGTDVNALNDKYKDFIPLISYWDRPTRLQFFPLKDLYMGSVVDLLVNLTNTIYQQGNQTSIVILLVVVVLLLAIGLFNYINIYTVLMLNRAREFGVKKVYGAGTWTVLRQIWLENLVVISIALLFVWAIIELTYGLMESLLSIPIKQDISFDVWLSVCMLVFFSFIVSLAPALKYSYAPPVSSLRSVNVAGKSVVSRTVFLALQYMVTFFIVVVSMFFMKQLHYMLNTDLGYRTENVVKFSLFSSWSTQDVNTEEERNRRTELFQYADEVMKQKLSESPLFEKWSKGDFLHSLTPFMPFKKDDGEYKQIAYASLDRTYMDMFDFQLLEGRLWDSEEDEWAQYKIIINETAKKLFGINDISTDYLQPESRIWWSSEIDGMDKNPPYQIVGVIKDFKINHLSKANIPLGIVYSGSLDGRDSFVAVISPGKKAEAIKYLRELSIELMGEGDFEYSFLEDEIGALYNEDKQILRIYITFSIIAIFISCLGLYGLSLFDIRQRYREIALRKINGASVMDIVSLLHRKYGYILLVSFIIATAFSYWIINKYLENFAHKAPVSWWLFAVAGIVVALISYITLGFQIRKAIRINPAEVLKGE